MSYTVPTAHVQQYRSNIIILSQQKGSRLRRAVNVDADMVGKNGFFDRISKTAAQKTTARHADTPLMNTQHTRRRCSLYDYDWADLVDKSDKLRMLADPTGPYTTNAMYAMGRSMDDEIITAFDATAYEGETGATSTDYDDTNWEIAIDSHDYDTATGNTGLTISKLLTAKEKLDAAEVDEDEPRFIYASSRQINTLLATTEVGSADYNTVKALAAGQLNSFLGFEFIRGQRATLASSVRDVFAWPQNAMGLAVANDVEVDVAPRKDKRNSTQVYVCMNIGAVRIEDTVVRIKCAEA